MKLSKLSSNSKLKKKHRKMYFKKRNNHLFKSKVRLNSIVKSRTENSNEELHLKIPILTCIQQFQSSELSSTSNESIDSKSQVSSYTKSILFNDYLLISSKTKYKYLLFTLFEKVNLLSKENYIIVDGFLKLNNWEPINLNSICSISQCLNKSNEIKSDVQENLSSTDYTKNIDESDLISVYDILKQVISLISITIRVKLKNQSDIDLCNVPCVDIESNSKRENLKSSCLAQLREKIIQRNARKQKDISPSSQCVNQESETVELNEQQEVEEQNEEPNEEEQENEIEENEDQEDDSFSSKQFQNNFNLNQKLSNMSPNLSTLLYTNPQLASLFPMFNLPILSQYLNGFKKPDSHIDYSNLLQNKLNPNSSTKQSSSNLSIETRLLNTLTENSKPNNFTSPSSSFSSASSTSSTSSFKPNQNTNLKQSFSEDFKNSNSFQFQKQLKQSHNTCSNQSLSKEKKQRERTTFDPHEEISRLMQIFEQTHHPSRYQIANICDSLNSLACRKDKKPLEPYNIQYWFKNARAALRRKSKSENSVQGKNPNINEMGSNEDSKNSFDDFDEENNLENSDIFQNQQGVKHENIEQSEKKINYDYQEDETSIIGLDNQNQANSLHKNFSTNSLGATKNNGSRRNRVFIDPISEVPILEHYFSIETYPDHYLIEKICDILNKGEYRYKFPKLEARNIQLWFKNHRAKLKRLKSAASESNVQSSNSANAQNDKANYGTSNNNCKLYNNFERDETENCEAYDEYDYGDYENDDNGQNSQTITN